MRHIQAYLFLQEAEQMPHDAPDEWFLQTDPSIELVNRYKDILDGLNFIMESISEDQSEEEIQAVFYEAGKRFYGTEKAELRMFFRGLYQILLRRPSGPRWGQLVTAMSLERFRRFVEKRLENPFVG